ncbi:MAG TPA: beta-ketoacyl reductase [Polyangiaceae bacterium]|nr:beta-ketoacyl reductase [Polyangiaceae bacterium]
MLHSAGVFDDGGLTQQSEQRFANVLDPKVHGGRLLDALTRDDPLDFFVLFSSAAAVLGSAGQTNYSAANAYLDGLAHERRSRGVPALSVNWGAWAETGVAVSRGLLDRLAAQGLAALTAEQSLLALQRLLESGATQAAVMAVDWKRYVERVTRGKRPAFLAEVAGGAVAAAPAGARTAEAAKGDSLRQQLAEAVPSRRKPLVAAFVRERALRALGVDPAKPVDPRTPLGDLGLDSLLAVDLRNTLGSALGKPLPATLLFDHPSIEALTDYLLSEVLHFGDEAQGVSPDVAPAVPAVRELVGSIEAMSDDEVDRLIAARAQRKA